MMTAIEDALIVERDELRAEVARLTAEYKRLEADRLETMKIGGLVEAELERYIKAMQRIAATEPAEGQPYTTGSHSDCVWIAKETLDGKS